MHPTKRASEAILCALLSALFISAIAKAQSNYLIPIPIPLQPGGLAVNNNTQVLYGSGLYSQNTLTAFPAGFTGWALSENGVVAGSTTDGHLAIYSAGVVTDLGALPASPPAQQVYPSAINASGQIAGALYDGTGDTAFIYSNGTVNTPFGPGTSANGMNDSGQVVACTLPPFTPQAFIFTDGAVKDLGPGCANAINASGEITGWTGVTFQTGHAYFSVNGKLTVLREPPPYTASGRTAINAGGQIVGSIETAQTSVPFFYGRCDD